ncbi:hypothetical protein [Balneola vulgaris]|uniref:hypothetical protein n=1 Tax=Balneola vulgaris TaxID=287535 RepID=UPI000382A80A|nr:hypothetical protein [Balneola vulgaris]
MITYIRIFIIALIIILGSLLLYRLNAIDPSLSLNEELKLSQTKNDWNRNWLKNSNQPIQLNSDITEYLYKPEMLDTFNDTLYITDYADMHIKRFTKDGKYIDTFGNGKGRGPGELSQILDVFISPKTLYAIDAGTFQVKRFERHTKTTLDPISYDNFELRVTVIDSSIVLMGLTQDLFRVINNNGKVEHAFGTLANDQFANILSFDGLIIPSNNKNEFIYLPFYASYMFFYDLQGRSTKTVQTLDRLKYPESSQTSNGQKAPSSPVGLEGVSYNDDFLFLQYVSAKNTIINRMHTYVDIYSRSGDKYFGSILFETKVRGIAVIDQTIYTMNDSLRQIEAFVLPEIN